MKICAGLYALQGRYPVCRGRALGHGRNTLTYIIIPIIIYYYTMIRSGKTPSQSTRMEVEISTLCTSEEGTYNSRSVALFIATYIRT